MVEIFPLLLNFTQTRLNSHNSPAGWLCDFPILPTFIQLCRHKNAIYCRSSLHPESFLHHATFRVEHFHFLISILSVERMSKMVVEIGG